MPANSHLEETTQEDGSSRQKLVVEFTNGSLSQLKDLGKSFKVDGSEEDPYKVIEFAIGLLETVRAKTPELKPTDEK